MFGTFYALVMLAMPATAGWALVRSGAFPGRDLWLRIWPTAWFPVLWVLFWWEPLTFYDVLPDAFRHWIFSLPLASWMVISLCCRPSPSRHGALLCLLLIIVYQTVVFFGVGSSRSGSWSFEGQDHRNRLALIEVRSDLRFAPPEFGKKDLAPGWIEELPPGLLSRNISTVRALGTSEQRAHVAEWHTWLTGLYHVEPRRAGIWYPGGNPEEAAHRVEWRPR